LAVTASSIAWHHHTVRHIGPTSGTSSKSTACHQSRSYSPSTHHVDDSAPGLNPEVLTSAESAGLGVPGVEHVHVRDLWLGRTLLVEVEGFIAASILLADAELMGRTVRQAISAAVPECRAVVWTPHALPAPG
jgi:hypothetical protein